MNEPERDLPASSDYVTSYDLSAKFQIMIALAANVPSRWAAEIRAWS